MSYLKERKPGLNRAIFTVVLFSLSGVSHKCFAALAKDAFTLDLSSKAGVKWEFQPEGGSWVPIQVPSGGWRTQGYSCDAATYRATIHIPFQAQRKDVRVCFDAVNFGADVYCGSDAGRLTKVASHVDGWVPFFADISSLIVPGSNALLVVDVKGRHKYMVGGRYIVPEGASWDDRLEEGIIRGISLQILPLVHVDDVYVKTSVSSHTLCAFVTVTNGTQSPVTARILGRLSSCNHAPFTYPKIPAVSADLPPNSRRVIQLGKIRWDLGNQSYWWPNVPYRSNYTAQLHDLDLYLRVNGKNVHHWRQRFGFREFCANGNHYELNGIWCNLRGDNQQEANFGTDAYGICPGFGPPSPQNQGWPRAVDNLLHLNFNVLRIHQIPATPYMLNVCDEQGLMLVDESPLRGSEGKEDFEDGRTNMLSMDRELVLRDRNHPSVILWSAANEWAEPIPDAAQVIQAVDDTRPIIADGADVYDPLGRFIGMQHYVDGLGALPLSGGRPRKDRPYGETEAIWPNDNTWQGFAWMATSVRIRRLKGDCDLRNYVVNNAWPNYVPGQGPATEILEKKVKNWGGDMNIHDGLSDPWNNRFVRLMQKCYNPVAVCDPMFDLSNALSNAKGEWPIVAPQLSANSRVTRELAVFNDEFSDENVTVRWEVRQKNKTGPLQDHGVFTIKVPLGGFCKKVIQFTTPKEPGKIMLLLNSSKENIERFSEDEIEFSVVPTS